MAKILILYSTTDGQTLRIGERVRQHIEAAGNAVTLAPIIGGVPEEIEAFDTIVIGARIRYGRHQPEVADFIRTHRSLFERVPCAFFSVNIVARKPEKNRPETNPYVRKFLRRLDWRPALVDVFAGKLDYPRYRFIDRQMIRLIMWITKGPTDPATVMEFTDWRRVEEFSRAVCALGRA